MLLNEYDPYRFVTHKQLKVNPFGVFVAMEYYVNELKKMVERFKDGEEFGPVAKAKQEEIRDFFHKEAERLIEPGQNLTEFFENKLPVKLKNTPELAGLYIIMQNQKYAFRPIQADASREGLKKVMGPAEILTIVKDKNNKVKVFRSGKRTIFDPRDRIYAVSKRMKNTELRYGDGWKLIQEMAGKGDFVPVDTSYLGKNTSNYNKMTREDCNHDIYMDKVHKYLMPAAHRGAKLLITNNWDNGIVQKFQRLGLSVFKANRKSGVSSDTSELVAINFNPNTGDINTGRKTLAVKSSLRIKEEA
jgi:hypothetical protein